MERHVAGASYNLDCTVFGSPSRCSLTVALNNVLVDMLQEEGGERFVSLVDSIM